MVNPLTPQPQDGAAPKRAASHPKRSESSPRTSGTEQTSLSPEAGRPRRPQEPEFVPGELILKVNPTASGRFFGTLQTKFGATAVREISLPTQTQAALGG